jgi:branched-chain amino acid aminotransferase
MKPYVYLNGRIVTNDKALVPVLDRGLLYGDALFETLLYEGGKVLRFNEHLLRLATGARMLGFPGACLKDSFSDIKDGAAMRLIRKNGLANSTARLRVTVTRGAAGCGYAPPPDEKTRPTVFVTVEPVDAKGIARVRSKGVSAVLIRDFAPALPGVKTNNYLPNVLGKVLAKKHGAFEGIFVDKSGVITEATAANVFIVKRGVVRTPALSAGLSSGGVLPGVTRKAVIKLAMKKGFSVKEGRVIVKALLASDEVFLTNSILGIVPVVRTDKKTIGTGTPGKVTRTLQEAYGIDFE